MLFGGEIKAIIKTTSKKKENEKNQLTDSLKPDNS
jgi:hypothetical protein